MDEKLSLKDCDLMHKKVLIRVDFNVPLDRSLQITDDSRIVAALPTIRYVLEHGGLPILMSHLGRPKKKTAELSLKPIAEKLAKHLQKQVIFASDCIGPEVQKQVNELKTGDVLLLENLRFYAAEEQPEEDPTFAKQLASLGDIYVNDAFGSAHRKHASTATIANYFPGKSAAGFLMEKEIKFLGSLIHQPQRPFCALIGGAKISSKIGVLKALLQKVDVLLIGGAMAYTFLKAKGWQIGRSLYEEQYISTCKDIFATAASLGKQLILPVDHCIQNEMSEILVVKAEAGIPDGCKGVDIGPKTVQLFTQYLTKARTILWNGPLGVFEESACAVGTLAIAKLLPTLEATTIVGGGDSGAAIQAAGVADQISHLSTGGGASLEYIELETLPGIECLSNKS